MLIKSNQMYLLSTFNKKMRGSGEILSFIFMFLSCLSTFKHVHVAENMQQRPLGSPFSVRRSPESGELQLRSAPPLWRYPVFLLSFSGFMMTSSNNQNPYFYTAPFWQSALDMSWVNYILFFTVSSRNSLDHTIFPSWFSLQSWSFEIAG